MILNSNMCLQLIKCLLADPFHVHDFFRSGEPSVGFTIGDDVFGSGGADAGECVEFFQGGSVQVYFLSCSDIQMGGRCKCVEQKKSGTC